MDKHKYKHLINKGYIMSQIEIVGIIAIVIVISSIVVISVEYMTQQYTEIDKPDLDYERNQEDKK